MRTSKKLLSLFLSAVLCLSLLPTMAWADGNVKKVTDESALEAAIKEATSETPVSIELTQDITLTKQLEISANTEINLAGHNITANDCRAIHVKEGTLDITGKGTISSTHTDDDSSFPDNSSVIRVGDNNGSTAGLVLGEEAIVSTDWCYGITYFGTNNQTVTINGAVLVTGNAAAISGNGSASYGTADVTVNGVVKSENDNAIYNPQNGTLTINGTVEGKGGIEVKSGATTVALGDKAIVKATGTPSHTENGNGCSTSGYALVAANNSAYKGGASITVNGGTITGAVAIVDDNAVEGAKKASISITGGTFTVKTADELTNLLSYFAGDADATIELAKDVRLSSTITLDKNVIIDLGNNEIKNSSDFNGYLIKVNGNRNVTLKNGTITDTRTNETGTITTICNLGTLNVDNMTITRGAGIAIKNDESGDGKGGVLTVSNSTVTATSGANEGQAIQNWGTATITSGTFTGSVNTWSASDTWNSGATTINGGTFNGPVQSLQWQYDGAWPTKAATTTINGGNFKDTIAVCYQTGGPQPTTSTTKPDSVTAGSISITGGTFSTNPSGYVASGYRYTVSDGKYVVSAIPSSGGGGGGSSTTKTETTTNADGSKTTTTTDTKTGAVTETTTKTETAANGTKTETKVEVVTQKDGTVTEKQTETATAKNGTTATKVETTDAAGKTETKVEAKVTAAAVTEAKTADKPVTIPVTVESTKSAETAATVSVSVPKSAGSTKVEVPVTNVTAGTVAVLVKADGTEEIIKTSVLTEDGVALKVEGDVQIKIIDNTKEFTDVVDNHWAGDAIDFATSHEIFNGTGDKSFAPEATMTRAMLFTVLARFDDAPVVTTGENWYAGSMEWAKTNGVSDGTNPEASISREQLATMLYRYAGAPAVTGDLAAFGDAATVSDYAAAAMQWAVSVGLINGIGGNLEPQGFATRAQLAAIMQRFCTNVAF